MIKMSRRKSDPQSFSSNKKFIIAWDVKSDNSVMSTPFLLIKCNITNHKLTQSTEIEHCSAEIPCSVAALNNLRMVEDVAENVFMKILLPITPPPWSGLHNTAFHIFYLCSSKVLVLLLFRFTTVSSRLRNRNLYKCALNRVFTMHSGHCLQW